MCFGRMAGDPWGSKGEVDTTQLALCSAETGKKSSIQAVLCQGDAVTDGFACIYINSVSGSRLCDDLLNLEYLRSDAK